jgi:glycosyltransferase involved in cell wall biosynthesis
MRILYVVQRYGEKIVGGSEAACRHFAEQLVTRGHDVHVLTSCAHDYVDWADEYEPGDHLINGVHVHRLQIIEKRTEQLFAPIHNWIINYPSSAPLFEQQRWTSLMGPQLKHQRNWLLENAHQFDVVVFMTYLYATTTHGLPTVAGRVPTILQPTAHDEPAAYISIFNSVFRQPDAFLFFTPEERAIVERLYVLQPHGATIGIGIDTDLQRGDGRCFKEQFGIEGDDYLVYVGRLDASKGVGELLRFFDSFKKRNKSDLKLVLAGDGQIELPNRNDVVVTGFLDEQLKRDAIAGSLALVQPSYFESFSIVLCEAWIESRPALVQGRSEVLRGQAVRSNGAIPYEGFAEFEAAVNFLIDRRDAGDQMGRNGFEYVKDNYDWDVVLRRFEETIGLAQKNFSQRRFVSKRWR